jgi:hypothetical protein
MTKTKRCQQTLRVHQLFRILGQHPEGLSTKDMWSQLELLHHAENSSNGNGAKGSSSSFEEFSFFCVGPIKAGWLVVERNRWTLSITGRNAFQTYDDPHQLMTEAAKQSMQGYSQSGYFSSSQRNLWKSGPLARSSSGSVSAHNRRSGTSYDNEGLAN